MSNTHSLDLEESSSQYAGITDASQTGLDITGDITLEAWVNIESEPSGTSYMIMSKWDAANDASFMFRYQDDTGLKLRFFVFDSSNTQDTFTITQNLGTATWHHVAVSWDASESTAKFYVDGVQTGGDQTGSKTNIKNSGADFRIGARADDVLFFDGKIDECRIWNDIRTGQEIQLFFDQQLSGSETNLQGYWRLDNDYTDETSNSNDLTEVNSPVFSTDFPSWATAGVAGMIHQI